MSRKKQAPYVADMNGGRWTVILIAAAMIGSMCLRQFLSSDRVTQIVVNLIEKAQESGDLKKTCVSLDRVRFVWSDGFWPTMALGIDLFKMGPKSGDCSTANSFLQAERVFIPIRGLSLISQPLRVGEIRIENAIVDIDRFNSVFKGEEPRPAAAKPSGESPIPASRLRPAPPVPQTVKAWWDSGTFEKVADQLQGVRLVNTAISFENGSKKVFVNELNLKLHSHPDAIDMFAAIKMDPAVTYGEAIPPVKLLGTIRSDGADLSLITNVAEGSLKGTFALRPAEGERVDLDAQFNFKSIPVSTLAPLFTKSGLVVAEIQPKFLWLSGTAFVHGPMQGLFERSPLQLQNIIVEGDSSKLVFSELVRNPGGTWEPFHVQIQNFNMKRASEILGLAGAENWAASGVANGEIQSRGHGQYIMQLQLSDVGVQLSHMARQATQNLSQMRVEMNVRDNRLHGRIFDIRPVGGRFLGIIKIQGDIAQKRGSLEAELDELQLEPSVESALFSTKNTLLAGHVGFEIQAPKTGGKAQMSSLKGQLRLRGLDGAGWKLSELEIDLSGQQASDLELQFRFAHGLVSLDPTSRQYQVVKPAFMEQLFAKDGVQVKIESGQLRWRKNDSIVWEKLRGSVHNKQVEFISSGTWLKSDESVQGQLEVDYPSVRKLKWALAGSQSSVELKEDSQIISQLKAKGPIDNKVLGLKN